MNLCGERSNGALRTGFNLESEARSEADSAEHAQMVFREALLGVTDGAQSAGIEIGDAAAEIEIEFWMALSMPVLN